MTMTIEKKLRDFTFWSGAATNAAKLTPEELDKVEAWMEQIAEEQGEPWTTTEINDCMWFDFDQICELLGTTEEEIEARE